MTWLGPLRTVPHPGAPSPGPLEWEGVLWGWHGDWEGTEGIAWGSVWEQPGVRLGAAWGQHGHSESTA